MTIDVTEITRLRERAARVAPEREIFSAGTVLALLDELEKARAEVDSLKLERRAVANLSVISQICFDQVAAERDSAHELLRDIDRDSYIYRARIAAALGDK